MKKVFAAATALVLIFAACGDGDGDASDGPALAVSSSSVGDIVVDDSGNTLYVFIPDGAGDSTCYDQCAANWPPVTSDLAAGEGVDSDLVGSTTRTDGTTQITYNGWPLYYFANDAAPGDINGQGANDVWFVVAPNGEAVQ